jgi:hypothetical protein
MLRDQFTYLCQEAEAGRDAFVSHEGSGEHGHVDSCRLDHMMVTTSSGESRCWDYNECEEMHRTKEEFPWR